MQQFCQHRIAKDKFVLLIDNRLDQRLIKINENRSFKWRKIPIPLQELSKYAYYQQLEVSNNKLILSSWNFQQEDQEEEIDNVDQKNNNKEIFDIQEPQKLGTEQIEKMKKQLRPTEIINELVENNEQFNKRSEYSKLKYLKKKERKYMFKIHAEPTTLDNVHNYYFQQESRSICSIRWDMLALLLHFASPFQHVLLAEQSKGILLGALLIRGAKKIQLVARQTKALRQFPIVNELNIAKEKTQLVSYTNWSQLKQQKGQKFDNFILLGNYNFTELIQQYEHLLREGAIIAFYSQTLEPLQKAGIEMKKRGYLNVKLQDSWARQYQMLTNRTHPLMSMDSSSGYLLTAFKVK